MWGRKDELEEDRKGSGVSALFAATKMARETRGAKMVLTNPMPIVPAEDIGRVLKQILDRLNVIEKRLEGIEKLLVGKQPTP